VLRGILHGLFQHLSGLRKRLLCAEERSVEVSFPQPSDSFEYKYDLDIPLGNKSYHITAATFENPDILVVL
jgi:hypothetical protein